MLENIREDVYRYFTDSERKKGKGFCAIVKKIVKTEQLWIIIFYRYGNWLHKNTHNAIIRTLLKLPYSLIARPLELIYGINIPWTTDIGKGFYIGHYGGIWLWPEKMGNYCNVSQEVTIGLGGKGEFRGRPEIGDYVYIGPGAKIFGKIQIGNYVAIGANSVVSKSLPDNAVAIGNPARIVGYEGSKDLLFPDQEEETFFK